MGRSRCPGRVRPLSRGLAAVLPLLALTLVLGGCASSANSAAGAAEAREHASARPAGQPEEYQRIVAELRRATECVSAVESKRDFTPLRTKAPENGHNEPYPKQFMDKSKATPTERKLLDAYLTAIGPCQPDFGALALPAHRNITRMISETWLQQQELYRHLRDGMISWGVFNQGTRSNADKLSGGLLALRMTNEG